jgi:hypothetical protein
MTIAIYCFKNALFLLHAIEVRFGAITPPPFPIPKPAHIYSVADSALCSLLVHFGVIDISLSTSLSSLSNRAIPGSRLAGLLAAPSPHELARNTPRLVKEGVVLTAEQAYVLRGASIDACKLIIETAKAIETGGGNALDCIKSVTSARLDIWARTVVTARLDYGNMEIFTQRDTAFF